MDKHLQQTFDFRYIKIGMIVNGGVLQIGCGSGQTQRISQIVGYTTVGSTLVPLAAPQQAVPLQAPVRVRK